MTRRDERLDSRLPFFYWHTVLAFFGGEIKKGVCMADVVYSCGLICHCATWRFQCIYVYRKTENGCNSSYSNVVDAGLAAIIDGLSDKTTKQSYRKVTNCAGWLDDMNAVEEKSNQVYGMDEYIYEYM